MCQLYIYLYFSCIFVFAAAMFMVKKDCHLQLHFDMSIEA